MANEDPTWGAPRIHGELLKLGFDISERTVSRYLARLHPRDGAAHSWRTFLKNHREVIAGMDFFTVITANFRILYCLFLIHHNRREIIHLNVTEHPTGEWVVQQLRQAFPESTSDQYLIFDRDTKFSSEVRQFLDSAGVSAIRSSYPSPWQNGVAERWVRSFRNDLLDHVIVLHEAHLRRLARDYLDYYHADRTHDGLDKDTPRGRPPLIRSSGERRRHILVWEVSTIAIPGQRLPERCGWSFGDVQLFPPPSSHDWRLPTLTVLGLGLLDADGQAGRGADFCVHET
jgi:transposase InsO family protein